MQVSFQAPENIARWFERDIIARYGVPRIVRSDNGLEFEGEFAALMKTYGIQRRKTSAGNPQTNGQAERTIKCTKHTLCKYVDGSNEEYWSEFLTEGLFRLRYTKAESIGMSPFLILHGFEPDFPSPIQLGKPAISAD